MVESRASDIVYEDDSVLSFISSHQFVGTPHQGHALVVPREHYENIFDLPDYLSTNLMRVARIVSAAMLFDYHCHGTTIWQNNGLGCQTVWHYHSHVFPRYANDTFMTIFGDESAYLLMNPSERAGYAERLRISIRSG